MNISKTVADMAIVTVND